MPDEAGQDRLAQFEQAVTTLITCRSVVRHFTILGEAQQKELLTEIDATLQFLRASLLACTVGTPNQSTVPEPQQPESGALIVREEDREHAHTEQYTLKTLYKMYHTFLSDGRSDTISSFAARFSEAMSLLSAAGRSHSHSAFRIAEQGHRFTEACRKRTDSIASAIAQKRMVHFIQSFERILLGVSMFFALFSDDERATFGLLRLRHRRLVRGSDCAGEEGSAQKL